MEIQRYSEIANNNWNAWIKQKGIFMFALREDVEEFIQHGVDEATIFLEPHKASIIKPKGNSNTWPGNFINCKDVQYYLKNKLSDCTMLEFGCGGGRLSIPFSRRFKYVFGYDISDEAIIIANRIKHKQDISNIKFYSGSNIFSENVKEETMDFIFSYIVFQHISCNDTIKSTINDFSIVLKRGGLGRIHVRTIMQNHSEENCYFGSGLTVDEYTNVLLDNNLDVLEVEDDGSGIAHFLTFRKK